MTDSDKIRGKKGVVQMYKVLIKKAVDKKN